MGQWEMIEFRASLRAGGDPVGRALDYMVYPIAKGQLPEMLDRGMLNRRRLTNTFF